MSEGRLKAILFASLAVNLLLIGGGVGAYVAGVRLDRPGMERGRHGDEKGGPRPEGGGGFMRSLDPESRAAVRRELTGVWSETQALRTAARDARQEVERIATLPTYDPEALRTALAWQRAADAALQASWHDAIARALVNLKPEERREAVQALARERRRAIGGAMGALRERRKAERRRDESFEDRPEPPPAPDRP